MPRAPPSFNLTFLNPARDFNIVRLVDSRGQDMKIRKRGASTKSRRRSSASKRRKSRRRSY